MMLAAPLHPLPELRHPRPGGVRCPRSRRFDRFRLYFPQNVLVLTPLGGYGGLRAHPVGCRLC